ncbi:MAG: nitrogenase component 1 [bacterium]
MSATPPQAPAHELVQPTIRHGFLDGVLLAVNAVRDAFLFFDAPGCGYEKLFSVTGTHDLLSDLYRVPTGHRVHCTRVDPDRLVHDRSEELSESLRRLRQGEDWPVILVASMPAVSVTGIDYDAIIADAAEPGDHRLVHIRAPDIGADWLEGYAETLLSLSRQLPLDEGGTSPKAVAVVGALFDRNEGDHVGNLAELRRACTAVGLNLVSVWPGGEGVAELAAVGRAGTILSLPYGRQAAAELARRTGANLVEMDLPLGLQASQRWTRTLGEIAGAGGAALRWAEAELDHTIPLIDAVLEDHLLGRRFGFYGEPLLGEAVLGAFAELGCQPAFAALSVKDHAADELRRRQFIGQIPTLYRPSVAALEALDRSRLDFCVGSSDGHYLERILDLRRPFVELGYPSYHYHCLRERPFLLFRGFVDLVNRVVNR